jgi:hypothetical protein
MIEFLSAYLFQTNKIISNICSVAQEEIKAAATAAIMYLPLPVSDSNVSAVFISHFPSCFSSHL